MFTLCFFSFFCDMSTQEGGEGIRTNNLRFMRRGSQPIELLLEDIMLLFIDEFIVQIIHIYRDVERIQKGMRKE